MAGPSRQSVADRHFTPPTFSPLATPLTATDVKLHACVASDAHKLRVCSFVVLFNDLNLKIMKLTLYAVQKIHCPSYLSHFVPGTCYQSTEITEMNNFSYFQARTTCQSCTVVALRSSIVINCSTPDQIA